ncbi:hypothetical protein ACA910_013094 [Epithemia clementina (nom. ined.)]
MKIGKHGMIAVAKARSLAFIDPTMGKELLDQAWIEEWKDMIRTKEDWIDKFVSAIRLYAKKCWVEEELLSAVDNKTNQDDLLDATIDDEEEETTLDEAEIKTHTAGLFRTPKTTNKHKKL